MSVCLPVPLKANISETVKGRNLVSGIQILDVLGQRMFISAGYYVHKRTFHPLKSYRQVKKMTLGVAGCAILGTVALLLAYLHSLHI